MKYLVEEGGNLNLITQVRLVRIPRTTSDLLQLSTLSMEGEANQLDISDDSIRVVNSPNRKAGYARTAIEEVLIVDLQPVGFLLLLVRIRELQPGWFGRRRTEFQEIVEVIGLCLESDYQEVVTEALKSFQYKVTVIGREGLIPRLERSRAEHAG